MCQAKLKGCGYKGVTYTIYVLRKFKRCSVADIIFLFTSYSTVNTHLSYFIIFLNTMLFKDLSNSYNVT